MALLKWLLHLISNFISCLGFALFEKDFQPYDNSISSYVVFMLLCGEKFTKFMSVQQCEEVECRTPHIVHKIRLYFSHLKSHLPYVP